MKRHRLLVVLLETCLIATLAQAQVSTNAQTAWWMDAGLLTRLGLTDAQRARIENTFQAHRQNLASNKETLERHEAQLPRLLAADPIDRSAVFTQIDRVIQARSDMERTNAAMTLEMREQLTAAQWTQLQVPPAGKRVATQG